MATIVTRSGKGSPLTNNEVDANFTNLNSDKLEIGGGTLTGALTVDAGISIDNITIDANKIATSSGNFTIDSASDIILDCDGANVFLKDDTVSFGKFNKNGNNLKISSEIENGDIIFAGDDGGSPITALTLDMSNAGTATFNHDIILNDGGILQMGTGNDFRIFHSGTNSFITEAGQGSLFIDSDNTIHMRNVAGTSNMAQFTPGGSVKLYESGSQKFATVSGGIQVTGDISNASGDLTLDVAGDIILDADGGDVKLKDAGTSKHTISMQSNGDTYFVNETADADIYFRGVDGTSTITALSFDMSNAGSATFNNSIIVGNKLFMADNKVISFGAGEDLTILSNGSHGLIKAGHATADIRIESDSRIVICDRGFNESFAIFNDDDDVKLFYDGNQRFATTSGGIQVTGDISNASGDLTIDAAGDIILDADGADIRFADGGSQYGFIQSDSSNLVLKSTVADKDIILQGKDSTGSFTALTLDMSASGAATFNAGATFGNSVNISHGTPVLTLTDTSSSATTTITLDGVNTTIDSNGTNGDIIFKGSDDGSEITALTLDMSASGTMTTNSNIIAGGNIFRGNMQIESNEIDVSSGNFTLDVAGDISFDADGQDIKFLDGGTEYGKVRFEDPNFVLKSSVQDGDILFKGDDGGSTILALKLDMSAAGEATFNAGATLGGNLVVGGVVTANAGVVVDTITIDGSEIDSSSSLTLDVGGNLTINVDGTTITLADDTINFGQFFNNSSGQFNISAPTQDKDIVFLGNDGGSTITALTLDMSNAGTASFNHDIKLGDGGKTIYGADQDLVIQHTGSHGNIANDTGNLTLDVAGDIILDADGGEFRFKDGGTLYATAYQGGGGNFYIASAVADKDLIFQGNDSDGGGTITALTLDMSQAGAATFGGNLTVNGADVTVTANIKHAGDTDTFYGFHGNNLYRVVTGGLERFEVSDSGIVINDVSEDYDFRVESNGNPNMLFVDGGNNHVNIGSSTDRGGLLNIETSDNTSQLVLVSTDGDASSGPRMDFLRVSGTPADDDSLAQIRFMGQNDASEDVTYAAIAITASDVSDGTEDGQFKINTMVAGTSTTLFKMNSSEVVLNESSKDIDFRVESNGNANMLFVDGGNDVVGIAQSSPSSYNSSFNDLVVGTSGATGITVVSGTSHAGTLAFADGTSGDAAYRGFIQYNHSNDGLAIGTSGATQVTIDTNGKVLINDSSSHTSDFLQIETPASGGGHGIQIRRNDANNDQTVGAITFGNNTDTDLAQISAKTDGDSNSGDSGALLFSTQTTGGSLTERLRITSTGSLAKTSGDLTLDVAGDIILDADGGDVILKDDGTEFGRFVHHSAGLLIRASESDQDLFIQGTDGGSTINALTFDMSNAGNATFNGSITADTGVTVDQSTFEGNKITTNQQSGHSGNFTLDMAGEIIFDTDGAVIRLKDNGTEFGKISQNSNNLRIFSSISDADMLFQGNDGGSSITALTLDMSNAGAATFNSNISAGDISGGIITASSSSDYPLRVNSTDGFSGIVIADNSSTTNGNVISVTGDTMNFFTGGTSSSTDIALTLASNNNATFTGSITASGGQIKNANNANASSHNFLVETTNKSNSLYAYGADRNGTMYGIKVDGGLVAENLLTRSSGTSNLRLGNNAGNSIVSGGTRNTLIGDEAGTSITTGDYNVALGYAALDAEDAGSRATALGYFALSAQNTDTDSYNVAVGFTAGESITTGVQNTLIGGLAGDALTTASNNIAIGYNALTSDTLGGNSLAIGSFALDSQNFTSATDVYNVAVGHNVGTSITTGIQNTLIGGLAGDALTDSDYNVAVGYQTLSADTLGTRSVAVGYQALTNQNFTSATQSYNVAVGHLAGSQITTGQENTLIGSNAGDALTTGNTNTAVGSTALGADTLGDRNVAIGRGTLTTQNFTSSTDSYNTAVGYDAGNDITTGVQNTLIGGLSGDAFTDADFNTAIGYASLSSDTQGSKSVAIGNNTLASQNFTSATDTYNVAVGYNAGLSLTTGTANTLIGGLSGDAITTGFSNTAVGYNSLSKATTGDNNVAVGSDALFSNTVGDKNVAVGRSALLNFDPASDSDTYNTAVGHEAGKQLTTGIQNTLIGGLVGDSLTNGDFNVAIGYAALDADTLGDKSVAIGKSALTNQNFTSSTDTHNTAVGFHVGLNVTTGLQNTLIGSSSGDSLTDADFNVAVGYNTLGTDTLGSRSVAIGYEALKAQNFTSATNSYNTAVGFHAGNDITTGTLNTIMGGLAGDALTTGFQNVAIGYGALGAETVGGDSVAIGTEALLTQNTSATSIYNVAIGTSAGRLITSGTRNTLIGGLTGDSLTTGQKNVAIGTGALSNDDVGNRSTAVGDSALASQNLASSTDTYNTAVGNNAGLSVTTGLQNTIIGGLAGDALTDADFNVAVGQGALSSDTLGSRSVAIGTNALTAQNFTSATNTHNTAVGQNAGGSITTGTQNTLIGALAGDGFTVAFNNVAMGYAALGNDLKGGRSVAIGTESLTTQQFGTTTNVYNVGVGYQAGRFITSGVQNTLLGGFAGDALTDADLNVAIGYNALSANTVGSQSVAVGAFSLGSQNPASAGNMLNTAVGHSAGFAITTGTTNTLMGALAGDALTVGNSNVVMGYNALGNDTKGDRAVAIGLNALAQQNFTTSTDNYNVAVGYQSGYAITDGKRNTLIGGLAGDSLTEADDNVAIGQEALTSDTLGFKSVAIGRAALTAQNFSSATDTYNTAVGYYAGVSVTTGLRNTLLGGTAGDAVTVGDDNVAIGVSALTANTQGNKNVAVGNNTLGALNITSQSDSHNIAVGHSAGLSVTTGVQNVLIGSLAGDAITDADFNIAIGYGALGSNTLGSKCVAIGQGALVLANPSGAQDMHNVAIGHQAGNDITTGTENTIIGSEAGDKFDDASENTAVGSSSLASNCGNGNSAFGRMALRDTTGSANTAIGHQSGILISTGNDNTSVGKDAGATVTSGSNNLLLGHDAGASGSPGGSVTTQSNIIGLGDENITSLNAQVSLTVASDERDKTDFTALDVGLDFVKQLKPYTYKWDKRSKYGDKTAEDYDLEAQTPDGTHKEDSLDIGFKAQDVEALEKAAGYDKENKTNLAITISEDGKQYGMKYEKLIPILTKAIQEQQDIIESLTARITELEKK